MGKVKEIIIALRKDFLESSANNNARKGGLIAMAAIALGLGEVLHFLFSMKN